MTESCKEKVMKTLPCGHSARISCHDDPATYSCEEPCVALLEGCQHRCQGSCGKCKEGTVHIPCQNECGRTLPCGHICEARCSFNRAQSVAKSGVSTTAARNDAEIYMCKPCLEPCSWQCEHHKCEKICHEICTRPRCNLPCPKLNPNCGHPCIGLCGEPCPTKCRVCHPETLDIITQMTLEKYKEADKFVQLEDCGHIFEVCGLDTWMDSNETAEEANGLVAIKLKECPECRTLTWKTHRYSNVVKRKHLQVEDVKKRVSGLENMRQGNLLLQNGDHMGALSAFEEALQDYPGLMEAHFGIGCAFCERREYARAIFHLSFIVERSSFSSVLANLIKSVHGKLNAADFVEKLYGSTSSRAGDSIAMQAILQWAAPLKTSGEIDGAVELCDAVLGRDPENSLAKVLKEGVNRQVLVGAVKAMAAEVGQRGQWYTCPDGHYYCTGECGRAMEVSKCPDCNAQVGGQSHTLLAGNSHINIDVSEKSTLPGN